MSSSIWLALGTAVGIAAPALGRRLYGKGSAARRTALSPERATNRPGIDEQPFAAARIVPGICACKAVEAYQGHRILINRAPTLPVPGCDEKRCHCKFKRFTDRRDTDDRRSHLDQNNVITRSADTHDQRESGERREKKLHQRVRAYFNDYDA